MPGRDRAVRRSCSRRRPAGRSASLAFGEGAEAAAAVAPAEDLVDADADAE
ncbi:hypothetical protein [Streptomyces goshikiensis]|uniref:hypothetical protein n=1 Tax=Streptomyces goshikiensis TaxID=1942 RepID=UPI003659CAD5